MGSKLGHDFTEEESKERLLSQNKEIISSSSSSSSNTPVLGSIEDTSRRTTRWWCSCSSIRVSITNLRDFLQEKTLKLWKFGCSDPRKLIFSAKMGMALLIVAVIIFLKEPFEYLGQYSVWALLTVVLVFEFTIGGTLSKGFNRGLGTLSAGGLALGIAELSILFGKWEEYSIAISIFIVGFCTTFAKLYPTLKEYEYGFRVFLLTYCFIMVSGFSMEDFLTAAVTRFVLIALGAGVALIVNVCVYPIWAGEDLHNLVVKNFTAVATSFEGCVNGYLQCVDYERVSSKIHTYQASDDPLYRGYMSAIESTSQEDTLQGFASWEPPHGPYKKFRYPWKNYVKVSGALRYCTFTVMALHGCLLSEIQAPPEWRDIFSKELQKVGAEGANVLRQIGSKVQKMEKLSSDGILLKVHKEAEELQNKIDRKLYLLMNLESSLEPGKLRQGLETPKDYLDMKNRDNKLKSLGESENSISNPLSRSWNGRQTNTLLSSSPKNVSSETMFRKQVSMPSRRLPFGSDVVLSENKLRTYESASALSLATFASLLIEFVARLENLVNTFEELSEKANFKEPTIDEPSETETVGFWTRISRFCSYKS